LKPDAARDLSRSARAFSTIVWPSVAPACGGGKLVPVESVTATDMTRTLDVLAGIDAWQTVSDQGVMRGIASRVQWTPSGHAPFNTFTIRLRRFNGVQTEFEKRIHALQHPERGWLYPALTVHAYLQEQDDALLSYAVMHTRELYRCALALINRGDADMPRYTPHSGYGRQFTSNAEFIVLRWAWLADEGYRITTGGPAA
jgi:hypothetical protein